MQDSKDDWERECERMASIYRNSHVTIVATAATNSEHGFLYPPTPALQVRFSHASRANDNDANESRPQMDTAYVRISTSEHVSLRHAPLNQRAWVLQEQWLSARTLHFAKDQLFWSCKTDALSKEGSALPVFAHA